MKKIVMMVAAVFIFCASYTQSFDSIAHLLMKEIPKGVTDDKMLAFRGDHLYGNLLKDSADSRLLMLNSLNKEGIRGFVTRAPLDNMPVLRPTGNFPNRNVRPDPTKKFPMPNFQPSAKIPH